MDKDREKSEVTRQSEWTKTECWEYYMKKWGTNMKDGEQQGIKLRTWYIKDGTEKAGV